MLKNNVFLNRVWTIVALIVSGSVRLLVDLPVFVAACLAGSLCGRWTLCPWVRPFV